MNGTLVVVDDVAASFAQLVVERSAHHPDTFSVAFSGGSTARDCYARLAADPGLVHWASVTAWWGDERCVPLDHPDSNYRLVEESLLRHVSALSAVHPMASDAVDAAEQYDALLAAAPPIDLLHLGLGPDGHTASLFPASEALSAPPGRLVLRNTDPSGLNPHARLTFTLDAIRRCRSVVVTVSGAAKQDALRRVLERDPTAPGSLIDGEDVLWIVDSQAMGH